VLRHDRKKAVIQANHDRRRDDRGAGKGRPDHQFTFTAAADIG
jgi:hypothetical protein